MAVKNTTLKAKEKVRLGKCEVCQSRIDMRFLFVVLDKKMCLTCGNNEIRKWNEWARETEGGALGGDL